MRHALGQKLAELSELTGELHDWAYCVGIYRHMHLPATIEEATAGWLWKVLQAIDTQLRRERKRGGQPQEAPF